MRRGLVPVTAARSLSLLAMLFFIVATGLVAFSRSTDRLEGGIGSGDMPPVQSEKPAASSRVHDVRHTFSDGNSNVVTYSTRVITKALVRGENGCRIAWIGFV